MNVKQNTAAIMLSLVTVLMLPAQIPAVAVAEEKTYDFSKDEWRMADLPIPDSIGEHFATVCKGLDKVFEEGTKPREIIAAANTTAQAVMLLFKVNEEHRAYARCGYGDGSFSMADNEQVIYRLYRIKEAVGGTLEDLGVLETEVHSRLAAAVRTRFEQLRGRIAPKADCGSTRYGGAIYILKDCTITPDGYRRAIVDALLEWKKLGTVLTLEEINIDPGELRLFIEETRTEITRVKDFYRASNPNHNWVPEALRSMELRIKAAKEALGLDD